MSFASVSEVDLRIRRLREELLVIRSHVFLHRLFFSDKRFDFLRFRVVNLVRWDDDVLVGDEFDGILSGCADEFLRPFGRVDDSGRREQVEDVGEAFDFRFLGNSEESVGRQGYAERALQLLVRNDGRNLFAVEHDVRPLFCSPVFLHESEPSLAYAPKGARETLDVSGDATVRGFHEGRYCGRHAFAGGDSGVVVRYSGNALSESADYVERTHVADSPLVEPA